MEIFKSYLRKYSIYGVLKTAYRRFKNIPRHPLQDFKTVNGLNLVRLGSSYGGWSFVDTGDLTNCTIISAGLGEDASFDLEFASNYNAKVVIVDPTPRAVRHFESIIAGLGKTRALNYGDSGHQPIQAYELTSIRREQLILVEKALWNESSTLKFFEPANPKHVSHSIVNYQNDYRDDTPYIIVEAITVRSLLDSLGMDASEVALLKLDIEGAEIEVLSQCLAAGIKPIQILVEYDVLNVPNESSFKRVDDIHLALLNHGYQLVHTDGQANYLYLRESSSL